MLLTVLPERSAKSMYKVHKGVTLALMSGGWLRNERKLGCRHCLPKIPVSQLDTQSPSAGNGLTQDSPILQEPQDSTSHNLFTFHGIRSHLRHKSVSSFPQCCAIDLHLDIGSLTWETKIFFVRAENLGRLRFLLGILERDHELPYSPGCNIPLVHRQEYVIRL
jgi:hypothetical protein